MFAIVFGDLIGERSKTGKRFRCRLFSAFEGSFEFEIGVSIEATVDTLHEVGCDLLAGRLAQPMAFLIIEELLQDRANVFAVV